jgi:hypothetical protein
METCAVEVGLIKKKPCGQAAPVKCANCEMALCGKHAIAQLDARRLKTGKVMCPECDKAQRAYDKSMGEAPAAPTPAAKPPAGAPAAKPAAPAAPAAAAKAGAAPAKPAAPEKPHDSADDPLEFKPTKK